MSYLQLEIEGKKYGLKFNQMTLVIMADYTKEDNLLATIGYALFYGSLYANSYVKREELLITFEQACDLFDLLNEQQIKDVNTAYQDSISFQKSLPKVEDKELKKKKQKKSTLTDV